MSWCPRTGAFALMALVTVAVGVLAVRQNSMLVAILGLIGGYSTPAAAARGHPNLPVLYAYLLVLGLGILWIAQAKQWRLLNYLSFLFTYALYLAALPHGDALKNQFNLAIGALAAFFVLHASLVYLHNIRRGIKATVLEIIYLVLNAATGRPDFLRHHPRRVGATLSRLGHVGPVPLLRAARGAVPAPRGAGP
jgi:uncharacterized membrane protein